MKKTFNVLGREYTLKWRTRIKDPEGVVPTEQMLGLSADDTASLYIKKGLDAELRKITVIHELLHAVISELENSDLIKQIDLKTEEKIVDMMSRTLVFNDLIKKV